MNWSEDLNQIISIFLSIRSLNEFKPKFEELINQNSLVRPIKTRLQIDQVMNQNNKRHPEILLVTENCWGIYVWKNYRLNEFSVFQFISCMYISRYRKTVLIKGLESEREREREKECTFVIGWWERKRWRFEEGRVWNSGGGVESNGKPFCFVLMQWPTQVNYTLLYQSLSLLLSSVYSLFTSVSTFFFSLSTALVCGQVSWLFFFFYIYILLVLVCFFF